MRVLIATEARYYKDTDGVIYTEAAFNDRLIKRYLSIFSEVIVVARFSVKPKQSEQLQVVNNDGSRFSFMPLPDYKGPWQYLLKCQKLRLCVREAIDQADAFILRVPGLIGTMVWKELRVQRRPFGVEVVGDPWDVFTRGSFKSLARPFIRHMSSKELRFQCREAAAAAYVTQNALQHRYPPGAWNTHYSSVDLAPEAFISDQALAERVHKLKNLAKNEKNYWCLIFLGGMGHLYKAPNILLKAVGACINEGLKLKLYMLGDGLYRPQLENLTAQLKLTNHVHFLGRLSAGNPVREMLDQADLFILPSFQEGLPRAMIEAMARGLPCIGSQVGGIPELLPPEDMVPPGDAAALARKIIKVVNDPERMVREASRNLEIAKDYREDVLRERRIKFYQYVKEVSDNWLQNNN